ncbi:MAG: hypothetical protein CMF37_15240 [Leeuwenhoekiella sp.]|jgi:hypothetical protein|nr:hypothetical protein [Leeuwenhoekiella sp.]MBH14266.1 hypothetical protein [Leeuwenhoekiella sp.]MBQ50227.1 hypothetical protein [Leeuwenhoekiella sp.]MBQ50424.1 hypothetical protein [Leeuwenhoekiella sp.]|tara:strand:- start:1421 stop:1702 length:282 start_codon:yes stop_codon:yes gene_type:complete
MPSAKEVVERAKRWRNATVVFDDDNFSVVEGEYRHDDGNWSKTMGVRWNGEADGPGYPKLFGNGVFMVVPDWMAPAIKEACVEYIFTSVKDTN